MTDIRAGLKNLSVLIDKFPVLDLTWPDEWQIAWWECWDKMYNAAADPPRSQRKIDAIAAAPDPLSGERG